MSIKGQYLLLSEVLLAECTFFFLHTIYEIIKITLSLFVSLIDVPSNGLYFLTYEYLKNLLTPEGQRSAQ